MEALKGLEAASVSSSETEGANDEQQGKRVEDERFNVSGATVSQSKDSYDGKEAIKREKRENCVDPGRR